MKQVFVSSLLSLGAAGAFAQATPAAPAAPEPVVGGFTANVNLTTKYKFRGQDQGDTEWFSPALQGGFDWSSNGFYLGNWNSNVSFTNASLEMDFYAGYKGEITKEFGYDVGILQYYYPQKDKVVSFNTTEIYGALTWQWLTAKYSYTVSGDYFGLGKLQKLAAEANGDSLGGSRGRGTGYVELNANFPIDKLTINAHAGYTHLRRSCATRRSTAAKAARSTPASRATTTTRSA
ncbi:MAG: TorF family putative porin [Burkholderiales bacterium]|nr:TorF family putative porin [Burkholderiales bacterium]